MPGPASIRCAAAVGAFIVVCAAATPALAIQDSSHATPSNAVRGDVTDSLGRRVAGATVRLIAVGESSRPVPGGVVQTKLLSVTTADGTGRFSVSAPSEGVKGFLRGEILKDRINVMVESLSPAGEFTAFGRVFIVTDASAGLGYFQEDASVAGTMAAPTVVQSVRATQATRRPSASRVDTSGLHLRLSKGTAQQERIAKQASRLSYAPSAAPVVSSKFIRYLGEAKTLVGQGVATTGGGGFTFDFTYTTGASSSLGVAISNSSSGGYSASGTSSVSTSASQDYPAWSNLGFHYNRTDTSWGVFLINGGSMYFPAYYLSKAYKVTGGVYAQNVTSNIPAYSKCKPYPAGSGFSKTSDRAVTWSNGVYVGSGINLSLSTNTGYSSQASVRISIKAARHICGSSGYPLEAGAYILEVRG